MPSLSGWHRRARGPAAQGFLWVRMFARACTSKHRSVGACVRVGGGGVVESVAAFLT